MSTVPGTLVRQDPGSIMLSWSGRILTGAEYAQIRLEQRNSQNYWKAEWAFPTGDICEHFSLVRPREFVCWGMHSCKIGDCCSQLETHNVLELRRSIASRAASAKEQRQSTHQDSALLDVVQSDLQAYWDGKHFGMINLRLSEYLTVQVCAASYALLAGLKPTSAQKVVQRIRDDVPLPVPVAPCHAFETPGEQSHTLMLEKPILS